jgi:hypothetical protein
VSDDDGKNKQAVPKERWQHLPEYARKFWRALLMERHGIYISSENIYVRVHDVPRPNMTDIVIEFLRRRVKATSQGSVAKSMGLFTGQLGQILKRDRGRYPRSAHLDEMAKTLKIPATSLLSDLMNIALELEAKASIANSERDATAGVAVETDTKPTP